MQSINTMASSAKRINDLRWRDSGVALTIIIVLQAITIAAVSAVVDNKPVQAHPQCARVEGGTL